MANAYYIRLIIRLFTDGLTKREAAKLSAWRQANPDNEHLFLELEQVWQSSQPKKMAVPANTGSAWQALKKKLTATVDESPDINAPTSFEDASKNTGWFWTAAAAILLAVSTAALLKYGGSKESDAKLSSMDSDNLVFHLDR